MIRPSISPGILRRSSQTNHLRFRPEPCHTHVTRSCLLFLVDDLNLEWHTNTKQPFIGDMKSYFRQSVRQYSVRHWPDHLSQTDQAPRVTHLLKPLVRSFLIRDGDISTTFKAWFAAYEYITSGKGSPYDRDLDGVFVLRPYNPILLVCIYDLLEVVEHLYTVDYPTLEFPPSLTSIFDKSPEIFAVAESPMTFAVRSNQPNLLRVLIPSKKGTSEASTPVLFVEGNMSDLYR